MPGRGFTHSVGGDINNLRNLLSSYERGFPILKELIQNADDAGATSMDIGWSHGIPGAPHPLLRGPALFATNNGAFSKSNERAIKNLNLSDKPIEASSVGKFGLGLKSLFHLCEAFFYLGSEGISHQHGLLNPWSPSDETEPALHPEWDDVPDTNYDILLSSLGRLDPRRLWALDDSWFCLWVPLRKQAHCKPTAPIRESWPGDDDTDPVGGLLNPPPLGEIALLMPMLLTLQIIRIWTPNPDGSFSLGAEVHIDNKAQRRHWRLGDSVSNRTWPLIGNVHVVSGKPLETIFGGLEATSCHEALGRCRKSNHWPKRSTLQPDGSTLEVPDKAGPHAAVYFNLFPRPDRRGQLRIWWAVFLPVGTPEPPLPCQIPFDIDLVMHGYFFVDAGRSHIDFGDDSVAKSNDPVAQLCHDWNRTVRDEVLLPNVLPALAHFVEHANLDEKETRVITTALGKSSLIKTLRLVKRVCGSFQWIYRISPSGGQWSLVGAREPVLEIPQAEFEFYMMVFPRLAQEVTKICITPSDEPRISCDGAAAWPEDTLKALMDVPAGVFNDDEQLAYLLRFLVARKADLSLFNSAQHALWEAVRRTFRKVEIGTLRQRKESVSLVLGYVPQERLFSVPLGKASQLADSVFKDIALLDLETLLVPEELFPGRPDDSDRIVQMSVDDAKKVLYLLAKPSAGWSGKEYDQLRSKLAVSLVQGVGMQRIELLERCAELPLFRGFDCAAQRETDLSYREIDHAHGKGLLFNDERESRELAGKLQRSLADARILLVPQYVSNSIFEASQKPTLCTTKGCIGVLSTWQRLGSVTNRVPLFKELVADRSGEEQDNLEWKRVVRYLIHGNVERRDNEEPLVVWDKDVADEPWGKLAKAALALLAGHWRYVPEELAYTLAPQDHEYLGLQRLSRELCADLLREAGPERISCEALEASERNMVLKEINDDDLDVLKQLRIHADINGILRSISADTYLEGTESKFPNDDPLTKRVEVIARCEAVEWRQIPLLGGREWNADAALQFGLQLDQPHKYAESILVALKLLDDKGIQRDSESVPSALGTTLWLVRHDGSPIAPEDVLYLPGLENVLAEVISISGGEVIDAGFLKRDFQKPATIKLLAKYAFSPKHKVLTRSGQVLAEHEEYLTGLTWDPDDYSALNDWVSVFANSSESIMKAVGLIRAIVEAEAGKYGKDALRNLLPELSSPLSDDRYVAVLNYIAGQHDSQRADRERYRTVHTRYLEEATQRPNFGLEILPKLLLMNQLGQWKPSSDLCACAENIRPSDLLHDGHLKLLENHVVVGTVESRPRNTGSTYSIQSSAKELVQYLEKWEDVCSPAILGAFVAILGDEPNLSHKAEELLSDRGRHVEGIRALFRWTPQPRRGSGWIAAETLDEIMATQGFSVCLVQPSHASSIRIANLIGAPFTTGLGKNVESLIIGSLPNALVNIPTKQQRVVNVTLRAIDPALYLEQAESIIKKTIERIWEKVYLQSDTLDHVWQELGYEDQLSVSTAQELIKENLFFHMGQLQIPHNETIERLRSQWQEARSRAVESERLSKIGIKKEPNQPKADEKKKASEELGSLLEENDAVQAAFYQAVKETIARSYFKHSIPFELFQNADDATQQLSGMREDAPRGRFVVLVTPNRLTFVHWGRRINLFRLGKFSEARFKNDLEYMLVMYSSNKNSGDESQTVTGKFGLGFKSVLLVSKEPRVLSGVIGFEVVGGVYPKLLAPELRQELRERVQEAGLEPGDATIIDLPLEDDGTVITSVLERFQLLAPILGAFARSIHELEIDHYLQRQRWQWQPTLCADIPGMEVGQLGLNEGIFSFLLLRAPDNAAILLALNERGVDILPKRIPSIWVTAPTEESTHIGFALNAMFAIEPGRAHLATAVPHDEEITRNLGQFLGKTLVKMASESVGNWDSLRVLLRFGEAVTAYDFWGSIWEVLGRYLWQVLRDHGDSRDVQIARKVLWEEDTGAMLQALRAHRVLPSMLPGDYAVLCALNEVRHQVTGVLNERQVFEQVAQWPSFQLKHVRGSIISGDQVGRPLQTLMPGCLPETPETAVNIMKVLQVELKEMKVGPEQAEMVGQSVSVDLLRSMQEGTQKYKDEYAALVIFLRSLRFINRSGSFYLCTELIIAHSGLTDNKDEPLRAAFAPDDRVLSGLYNKIGVAFFRLCREKLSADAEEMANWALLPSNAGNQEAALRYLLHGQLSNELRQLLIDHLEGTWLADLNMNSPILARFDYQERVELLAQLKLYRIEPPVWPPPPPPPPKCDTKTALERLAQWWQVNREELIRDYEGRVYPDGHAPVICTDEERLQDDVQARQAWLELFILAATFTLGRTTPEQQAGYLKRFRQQNRLRDFANPRTTPDRWMEILKEYFRDPTDRLEYYHMLRLFVAIFQFSNWLGIYIRLFLDIQKGGFSRLQNVLTIRQDVRYQGSGMDAPSLVPAMGYGACFVVRELVRQNILTSECAWAYCYVPQGKVRSRLEQLGCSGLENETRLERSPLIYNFLKHYLDDKATFGGSFDLPLLLASNDFWYDITEGEPSPEIEEDEEV